MSLLHDIQQFKFILYSETRGHIIKGRGKNNSISKQKTYKTT